MSDEELVGKYDEAASETYVFGENTVVAVTFFRDELARREIERQTEAIVALTRGIAVMTIILLVATFLAVVISFVALLTALHHGWQIVVAVAGFVVLAIALADGAARIIRQAPGP